MSVEAVLELYTLEELIELNDKTTEEILEFLVMMKILKLPEVQPLEF